MKLLCDVCNMAAADLICPADEAALCYQCDGHVHAANKLAGRHERLPLFPQHSPSHCDICQEKTGHFFCLDDRALLCRECDYSIHSSNDLVSKHKRFLLPTIRVGLTAVSPFSSDTAMPLTTRSTSPPATDRPRADVPSHAPSTMFSALSSAALPATSQDDLWTTFITPAFPTTKSEQVPNSDAHQGSLYSAIRCTRQVSTNLSDDSTRSDSFLYISEAADPSKMNDFIIGLNELITDPPDSSMSFINAIAEHPIGLISSIPSTDLTNSSFPLFDHQPLFRPTLKKRKYCLKV